MALITTRLKRAFMHAHNFRFLSPTPSLSRCSKLTSTLAADDTGETGGSYRGEAGGGQGVKGGGQGKGGGRREGEGERERKR